jgi:BRCT domain type II-containing protein
MRNRETIKRLLNTVESKINVVHMLSNRNMDKQQINTELDNIRELVVEIGSFIEQEPMSPNEFNKY